MDFELSEERLSRASVSPTTIYDGGGVVLRPSMADFGRQAHQPREPFDRGDFLRKS